MGDLRFEIEPFIARCPIQQYSFETFPYQRLGFRFTISGPRHIAVIEQLRSLAVESLGPAVPVDLFLWEAGEPVDRATTKIGGLPYRPAGKPWPRSRDDEPLDFIAQFSFSGSRDLFDELPGDVLLIFGNVEIVPEEIVCEWYPDEIRDEQLVTSDQLPDPSWVKARLHGYRYRTDDYIDLNRVEHVLHPRLPRYDQIADSMMDCLATDDPRDFAAIKASLYDPHADCRADWDVDFLTETVIPCTAILHGAKIGGVPIGGALDDINSEHVGQRFLCSLTDITTDTSTSWPLVSCPESVTTKARFGPQLEAESLYTYDGFILLFFLCDDGNVVADLRFWNPGDP